jgi:hypothetical protein
MCLSKKCVNDSNAPTFSNECDLYDESIVSGYDGIEAMNCKDFFQFISTNDTAPTNPYQFCTRNTESICCQTCKSKYDKSNRLCNIPQTHFYVHYVQFCPSNKKKFR